VNLLDLQRSFS